MKHVAPLTLRYGSDDELLRAAEVLQAIRRRERDQKVLRQLALEQAQREKRG